MDQGSEVVITGVGVVSPIGIGNDAYWEGLCAGRSGVGSVSFLEGTPFPIQFGAEIRNFDGKLYVQPRKSLKVMCREIQFGFSAATLAIQDSGLAAGHVDPERIGVVYGAEMYYGEIDEIESAYRSSIVNHEFHHHLWPEKGMSQLYPLWMLKYLPNMVACHIGIAQDARGPNNTITLGDASSLLAMIEAIHVIERGHADAMIVGGSGSRLNVTPLLYRGVSNLSHRSEDPQAASRPFDAGRDGIVNGEGSGAFLFESRRHAEARGARIRARVLGMASTYESPTVDQGPPGFGTRQAILTALRSSGLQPKDIGHVNAHGNSTVDSDRREAQAIASTLGDVPVFAPKSYYGSLGAGSGAVETAASVLSFAAGVVPRTLNYQQPDPDCPVNVLREPLVDAAPRALLLNQSGTGQSAALVISGP